jgi:hypothetical protein
VHERQVREPVYPGLRLRRELRERHLHPPPLRAHRVRVRVRLLPRRQRLCLRSVPTILRDSMTSGFGARKASPERRSDPGRKASPSNAQAPPPVFSTHARDALRSTHCDATRPGRSPGGRHPLVSRSRPPY